MARGHYWNDRNWRNRNINKKRFDTTNFIIIILIVILVIFFLNPELIDDLKVKTEIGNDKPLSIYMGNEIYMEVVMNEFYKANPGRFETHACVALCKNEGMDTAAMDIFKGFKSECLCDYNDNNPDTNKDITAEWKQYIEKYGK